MNRSMPWLLLLWGFISTGPLAYAAVELGATRQEADATVGCLFPMSGRGGLYGRDSAVGVELALEHLEQAGLKNTPRLRVLFADSKSKASRAVRQVRDFVHNEQARFICGVVNSAIALQVTQVAQDLEVFFIGTDHASSSLTGESLNEFYFRTNNDSAQSMRAGARYIREHLYPDKKGEPLRIAFIGPDYDYGYQTWKDLRSSLAREGVRYKVIKTLWPKLYEPDYTTFIRSLMSQQVDLVVNSLWGGDMVAFVQQAVRTDFFQHSRFANFDTGANYEVLSALGSELPQGLILSARHHVNWPDTKLNKWFVYRFHALTGRYPSYAAEGAYSGILAIAEALRQTGSDASNSEIRKALLGLKLHLPEDPEGFDSYMNPQDHQLQQVIAIGETLRDLRYPPAQMMLGKWQVYTPQALDTPSNLPTP